MKKLAILFLTGALFFAFPATTKAAEQCTTSELDLICPAGQVLRGIRPNGTKICVTSGLNGITLYKCPRMNVVGRTNRGVTQVTVEISTCVGQVTTDNHCVKASKYGTNRYGQSYREEKVNCTPLF